MVRERFIKHNSDSSDSNELKRMTSAVDLKIDEEIQNLRDQFQAIDKDQSQLITVEELTIAMKKLNLKLD